MRTRNREIELRKVCGSSIRNLFILFGTEYLFVLLLSGLVGLTFIELSLPKFRELSEINGDIYGESFLYFIGILFISYILLIPFIVRRYHRQSGSLFRFRIPIDNIYLSFMLVKHSYEATQSSGKW